MPSRNTVREYAPGSYYHVYNRGVAKQPIFVDNSDYTVFLSLLKRHLSNEPQIDRFGRLHPHYKDQVELLAFCLMPNHFHFLIHQDKDAQALSRFMKSVCTAYTMYFNRKYQRVGPLFQGRFKASRVSRDEYLQHISRYIHLNPKDYRQYEWSSLPYYLDGRRAEWLIPKRVLDLFEGTDYLKFLEDYKEHKAMLDELQYELADTIFARSDPAKDS